MGYKLTLKRNVDNAVLNKAIAPIVGENKIIAIKWYVPHFTLSIPQQATLSKQILSETHTELQYVKRSVFMEEVKTQNFWNFELGTQEGINTSIWIIVRFQQRDRRDSQNLHKVTF